MIASAGTETTLSPLSTWVYLKLTAKPGQSAGGVWLPDTHQTRATEGVVVALGPGKALPGQAKPAILWLLEGERVLFKAHDLNPWPDEEHGFVREEDLLALVLDEEGIEPLGDYVALRPAAKAAASRLGIAIPEIYRERERKGVILGFGPGRVRLSGPMAGLRRSAGVTMSTADPDDLIGKTAYWHKNARSVSVGGSNPCTLVHASDIEAIEEE